MQHLGGGACGVLLCFAQRDKENPGRETRETLYMSRDKGRKGLEFGQILG